MPSRVVVSVFRVFTLPWLDHIESEWGEEEKKKSSLQEKSAVQVVGLSAPAERLV